MYNWPIAQIIVISQLEREIIVQVPYMTYIETTRRVTRVEGLKLEDSLVNSCISSSCNCVKTFWRGG